MNKIYVDPVLGEVLLRKNPRARRITLRVSSSGKISVTLPWPVSYQSGISFLESRREWVLKSVSRINDNPPIQADEIERLRAQAKVTLPPRLSYLASMHGFEYKSVTIKNNHTNWGSCSTKGNINLNLRLVLLPQHLQDYVMLHELCHLKYMNHGPQFHVLLESLCPGHRKLAQEIKDYRLR